jgi:hypothetical protein
MTIQEAIKSGKPFRRKYADHWIIRFQNFFFVYREPVIAGAWMTLKFKFTPKKKGKKAQELKPEWEKLETLRTLADNQIPQPIILTVESILATDWEVKP